MQAWGIDPGKFSPLSSHLLAVGVARPLLIDAQLQHGALPEVRGNVC